LDKKLNADDADDTDLRGFNIYLHNLSFRGNPTSSERREILNVSNKNI
jgi:hypothetical protein